MLLILTEESDVISHRIFSLLQVPFCRIYFESLISNTKLLIGCQKEEYKLSFSNEKLKCLNIDQITYIWYRKGLLNFNKFRDSAKGLRTSVDREIIALNRFLNFFIESVNHLAIPKNELENNKIFNLKIAKNLGINIPASSILSKKCDLVEFYVGCNGNIINKGISTLLEYNQNSFTCTIGTVRITKEDIEEVDDCFFPSLFQEEIKKSFEIRSFYFLGKTYSIAIMSQENEETQLDFRDYSVFTRIQRYKLPSEVEKKVDKLMKTLGLKIGVLDFIYGLDEEIYFLEINPTGQIMRISELGNYQLDKLIANHLNQAVNG